MRHLIKLIPLFAAVLSLTAASDRPNVILIISDELKDYLVANELKENTAILYLADNGWDALHDMWGNLRAKLSPYEKGIRTPMMLRWPGKISREMDTVTLAHVTDFPKTILGITGAEQPGDLPGLNLMDREAMKARETAFVEADTHDMADLADQYPDVVLRLKQIAKMKMDNASLTF